MNGFELTVSPGTAMSSLAVGDFNNDGYADIVTGEYLNAEVTGPQPATGGAHVFFGGPTKKDGTTWKALETVNTAWLANGNGILFLGSTTTTGWLKIESNPANNTTGTLGINGGSSWRFVTGTPAGNQTKIQATSAATLQQFAADLNASADPNLNVASYASDAFHLYITYKTPSVTDAAYLDSYFDQDHRSSRAYTTMGYDYGLGAGAVLADVNGDGIADLLVSVNSPQAGAVYVIFGGSTSGSGQIWKGTQQLTTAWLGNNTNYAVNGIRLSKFWPSSIAVGDFNADGYNDIFMGGTWSGLSGYSSSGKMIVFGGPTSKDGKKWRALQAVSLEPVIDLSRDFCSF